MTRDQGNALLIGSLVAMGLLIGSALLGATEPKVEPEDREASDTFTYVTLPNSHVILLCRSKGYSRPHVDADTLVSRGSLVLCINPRTNAARIAYTELPLVIMPHEIMADGSVEMPAADHEKEQEGKL